MFFNLKLIEDNFKELVYKKFKKKKRHQNSPKFLLRLFLHFMHVLFKNILKYNVSFKILKKYVFSFFKNNTFLFKYIRDKRLDFSEVNNILPFKILHFCF